MKIIAQMDEMMSIDIEDDSTFLLLLEAQKRGYEIFYYLPKNLSLEGGKVRAFIHKIKLQRQKNNHCRILESGVFDLNQFDVILFRQDPPFDINYITSSYILERIKDQVLIINDPTEIRNCPEKIFVTNFSEFMSPTIITSDINQLKIFKEKHGDIVIKPLYAYGGAGIVRSKAQDQNLDVLGELMLGLYKAPLVAQKYISAVKKGDKRIILLDGKPLAALNRLATKAGEFRNNLHLGGVALRADLTAREKLICKKIGPELKKRGLIFVGIDIIGDYITEINVTSPTCLAQINRLNNIQTEKLVWDCFEAKIADRKKALFKGQNHGG